jgi:hypothetical protein
MKKAATFALAAAVLGLASLGGGSAYAQGQDPAAQPYQVEWVYRIQYGHQAEWWKIFQKYQIAILDREKQLGYVTGYVVQRPGLHTDESSRWDYRIIITYPNWAGTTHEGEVERQLFTDKAAHDAEEQRRWELTLNHWDLPIHEVDPHAGE